MCTFNYTFKKDYTYVICDVGKCRVLYHAICLRGPLPSSSWSDHNLLHLCTGNSQRYYASAMNHYVCLRLLMHFSINHSVLYNTARVRYITEQRVCLVQLYFKYKSLYLHSPRQCWGMCCKISLFIIFPFTKGIKKCQWMDIHTKYTYLQKYIHQSYSSDTSITTMESVTAIKLYRTSLQLILIMDPTKLLKP
jgi:hypothetical protein